MVGNPYSPTIVNVTSCKQWGFTSKQGLGQRSAAWAAHLQRNLAGPVLGASLGHWAQLRHKYHGHEKNMTQGVTSPQNWIPTQENGL